MIEKQKTLLAASHLEDGIAMGFSEGRDFKNSGVTNNFKDYLKGNIE